MLHIFVKLNQKKGEADKKTVVHLWSGGLKVLALTTLQIRLKNLPKWVCYMPKVGNLQEIKFVCFNRAMGTSSCEVNLEHSLQVRRDLKSRKYKSEHATVRGHKCLSHMSLQSMTCDTNITFKLNIACLSCEKGTQNIYSDTHWNPSLTAHQHCDSICRKPVTLTSLCLTESTILGKILNTASEEPMTSWSHKYYVLCFPHCCLMFHIEVETIKQTTAHKRMGPLIPRGIILVEGVFSTAPARESY